MPYIPPMHKPPSSNAGSERKPRYYRISGAHWRNIRRHQLNKEPLCRYCLVDERITAATEVDHIDNDANNNKADNLQSLCKHHHSQKTYSESSIGISRDILYPEIPKPGISVIVVCGAPGAGKSTYVIDHAGKNDIVIDLDQIKHKYGLTSDTKDIVQALQIRNDSLRQLQAEQGTHKAWFIVGAPLAEERRRWKEKLNARLILIETSPTECMDRIHDDETRIGDRKKLEDAVGRWWKRYVFDPESVDEVIRG